MDHTKQFLTPSKSNQYLPTMADVFELVEGEWMTAPPSEGRPWLRERSRGTQARRRHANIIGRGETGHSGGYDPELWIRSGNGGGRGGGEEKWGLGGRIGEGMGVVSVWLLSRTICPIRTWSCRLYSTFHSSSCPISSLII